eukprot:tig00020563_g11253.t1
MGTAEFDISGVDQTKAVDMQAKVKDSTGKVVGTLFVSAQYLPRQGPPVQEGFIEPETEAEAAARARKARGTVSLRVTSADKLKLPKGLVTASKLDPYCEIWVEGEKKPRRRTTTKKQTSSPVFDEDILLPLSEPAGSVVVLKFFDENPPLPPTLLGEIRIPISDAILSGTPESGQRALEGGTSKGESTAQFALSYSPEKGGEERPKSRTPEPPRTSTTPGEGTGAKSMKKSKTAKNSILDEIAAAQAAAGEEATGPGVQSPPPPPPEPAGRVFVRVVRGEGLPKVERFGTVDPYVVAELVGGPKAERSAVARGTDPAFGYEPPGFEVMELAGSRLRLAVWDQEKVGSDRGIAEAALDLADLSDAASRLAAAASRRDISTSPWACYPAKRNPGPPPTYVVIGRADDLAFAKTELLALLLQASLPCVTVQVDMFHPRAWTHQLRETCKQLGFMKHEGSPLVYDGSCRYIGGAEDLHRRFARLVLHKYGLADEASVESVREAAGENMELCEASVRRERLDNYLEVRPSQSF